MPTGRIIGIDFGEQRMGLALSDEAGVIALPLRTVEVESNSQAIAEIQRECASSGAKVVVLGLPKNMDGSLGPQAGKVLAFAKALRAALPGAHVETWDERLSSRQVERFLICAGTSRAKRRMLTDKLAAQLILQCYLDAKINAEAVSHDFSA